MFRSGRGEPSSVEEEEGPEQGEVEERPGEEEETGGTLLRGSTQWSRHCQVSSR